MLTKFLWKLQIKLRSIFQKVITRAGFIENYVWPDVPVAIFCEEHDADVRMAKIEKVGIWWDRVRGNKKLQEIYPKLWKTANNCFETHLDLVKSCLLYTSDAADE